MKPRTKDNLIYLAVALGIVAALVAYMFHFLSQGRLVPEIPLGPSWLVVSTIVLVAGTIQSLRRRHLKLIRHMPLIVAIVVLHPIATAVVLRAMDHPQLIFLVAMYVGEGMILLQIIDKLASRRQKGHN
jgi:4-hydroxybenzoate polyprenyltransferase